MMRRQVECTILRVEIPTQYCLPRVPARVALKKFLGGDRLFATGVIVRGERAKRLVNRMQGRSKHALSLTLGLSDHDEVVYVHVRVGMRGRVRQGRSGHPGCSASSRGRDGRWRSRCERLQRMRWKKGVCAETRVGKVARGLGGHSEVR